MVAGQRRPEVARFSPTVSVFVQLWISAVSFSHSLRGEQHWSDTTFWSKSRDKLFAKSDKSNVSETKIVWSQILPRSNWRYSENMKSLNHAAERINNFAAQICNQMGGAYIKYPELAWDQTDFFADDGVHLSDLGNDFFLYRLQMKLYALIM